MAKRGLAFCRLKHQKEKRSMDHFAGLDVSVKEISVCIVDGTGKILCSRNLGDRGIGNLDKVTPRSKGTSQKNPASGDGKGPIPHIERQVGAVA